MQQSADIPRAVRYEMSTSLLYRRVGADAWRKGRTVNVSRTGILFTGLPPFPDTTCEVELVLALPNPGLRGRPKVQCQGRVVRCQADVRGQPAAVAVTIDCYRILGTVAGPLPHADA